MRLSAPTTETIQKQHSAHPYVQRILSLQDRAVLMDCMSQLDNPLGVSIDKHIIEKKLSSDGETLRIAGAFEQMPQEGTKLPENIHYMIS